MVGNTYNVIGWSGYVTTTFLSSNMLGVYVYIYTSNLSAEPWRNAIQPSYKPTNWTGWCIDLGKVAANRHVYSNVCNFQVYDNSGYATYGRALAPSLLIDANNMYVYIGNKDQWTANAAILRISTVLKI